jgi:hypothetical protein
MTIQNKRLTGILTTVAVLLLIPLIAMQFSPEVNWSPVDFAVAGVLLFGTGLSCELVLRKVKKTGAAHCHLWRNTTGSAAYMDGTCGRNFWNTLRRKLTDAW